MNTLEIICEIEEEINGNKPSIILCSGSYVPGDLSSMVNAISKVATDCEAIASTNCFSRAGRISIKLRRPDESIIDTLDVSYFKDTKELINKMLIV